MIHENPVLPRQIGLPYIFSCICLKLRALRSSASLRKFSINSSLISVYRPFFTCSCAIAIFLSIFLLSRIENTIRSASASEATMPSLTIYFINSSNDISVVRMFFLCWHVWDGFFVIDFYIFYSKKSP